MNKLIPISFSSMRYNEINKMSKIYNVKYVDAYYTYEREIGDTRLSLFESYGYVERNTDNIVIFFIKKRGENVKDLVEKKENLIKGLVIPDTAIMTIASTYKSDFLKDLSIGSSIAVTWRDVTFVANQPLYECSIMYTEGILVNIKGDHIVLRDPETLRMHPTPVRNHPGSGRPTYLIVPLSFITAITVIKSQS